MDKSDRIRICPPYSHICIACEDVCLPLSSSAFSQGGNPRLGMGIIWNQQDPMIPMPSGNLTVPQFEANWPVELDDLPMKQMLLKKITSLESKKECMWKMAYHFLASELSNPVGFEYFPRPYRDFPGKPMGFPSFKKRRIFQIFL